MMNRAFLTVALISGLAVGCGEDNPFGGGGSGGAPPVIGPLLYTTPGLTVVGVDDCEFFVDEPLGFEITIQGSSVIMQDADPQSSLEASTDNYSPEQDEVLLIGSTTNSNFPPCVVDLDDAFQLLLGDPEASLDENTTLEVTWDHTETDVSATVGDCLGEWFVPLPCAGEATFTLTQQIE